MVTAVIVIIYHIILLSTINNLSRRLFLWQRAGFPLQLSPGGNNLSSRPEHQSPVIPVHDYPRAFFNLSGEYL